MKRLERTIFLLAISSFSAVGFANELTWTGAGDGSSFADAANWDGTPTGGALDLDALLDDFIIDDAAACVGCPGGVSQLTWGDPGVGSLTMSGGSLSGATGIRYTTLGLSGGAMTRQFLLNVTATIGGDAVLTMNGAGNPINLSTVAFVSEGASIHFTNETPDAVRTEHLGKITSFDLPAIEDLTIVIESDGAIGSVVSAIEYVHEAQTLTWTGAGDGESFGELANWDGGTPFGGSIDTGNLVDRYVINDGSVGGIGGVAQLYFFDEGTLELNGGSMTQSLSNAAQGVTGGRVEVTGGVLNRQFLSMCDAFISGNAQVVLNGGDDPVPFGAIVDLSGDACILTFLNEVPDDFRTEHLAKFRVDGEPAVEDVNILIAPLGKTGCIVTPFGIPCPADLNVDGVVDGADLTILLGGWGGDGIADLTGDGVVDGADLTILLGNWGSCPVNQCIGVDCDDGEPCTFDWCDPKTGECHHDSIPDCGTGVCGDPKAGSCSEANGTPACSNAACCEIVCEMDPYCCDTEWDASCVALTEGLAECR